jgi:hypothetical protein
VSWLVGLVWGIALLFAVLVLGVYGYELSWKARRLAGDLDDMRAIRDDLSTLQGQLSAVRERLPRRPSE